MSPDHADGITDVTSVSLQLMATCKRNEWLVVTSTQQLSRMQTNP
jgi:hypothetical protein